MGHSFYLWLVLISTQTVCVWSFISLRNGYLFDNDTQEYFVAKGFSYQVWNRYVFATQTFEQLEYDLREMKQMYVNSLRVEITWSEVELSPGVYDWRKIDHLMVVSAEMGIRLVILVGYQYPPEFFEQIDGGIHFAVHWDPTINAYGRSNLLNYEDPYARSFYASFITAVCSRYKNMKHIIGWIVGNEFSFFDLWEVRLEKRQVGHDALFSLPSFRAYLRTIHKTIGALNKRWGTDYRAFDEVRMPVVYPPRNDSAAQQTTGYYDVLNWREKSVARFLCQGALAAKQADPNHLITYSQVGGIFSALDSNIMSDHMGLILDTCTRMGAPLDFWSFNSYPDAYIVCLEFGVSRATEHNMPFMITETGASSTEVFWDDGALFQSQAVPLQGWDSLMYGAIGFHFFHWNDRDTFSYFPFPLPREAGFGAVKGDRAIKPEFYNNLVSMFQAMDQIDVAQLFLFSQDPPPDVVIHFGYDARMGENTGTMERQEYWPIFRLLGLAITFSSDQNFSLPLYQNAQAVFFPRAYQMNPKNLENLQTLLLDRGIHIHAAADFPGQFDVYHRVNPNWEHRTAVMFGLNVSHAHTIIDKKDLLANEKTYAQLRTFILPDGHRLSKKLHGRIYWPWKVWGGVKLAESSYSDGVRVYANYSIYEGEKNTLSATEAPVPQWVSKPHRVTAPARTHNGIAPTAGDGPPSAEDEPRYAQAVMSVMPLGVVGLMPRVDRVQYFKLIYEEIMGIEPLAKVIDFGDMSIRWRFRADGSTIIFLVNLGGIIPSTLTITLSAPLLIQGKVVQDLERGVVLCARCGATLALPMYAYGHAVLLASEPINFYSKNHPPPASVPDKDDPALSVSEPEPGSPLSDEDEHTVPASFLPHASVHASPTSTPAYSGMLLRMSDVPMRVWPRTAAQPYTLRVRYHLDGRALYNHAYVEAKARATNTYRPHLFLRAGFQRMQASTTAQTPTSEKPDGNTPPSTDDPHSKELDMPETGEFSALSPAEFHGLASPLSLYHTSLTVDYHFESNQVHNSVKKDPKRTSSTTNTAAYTAATFPQSTSAESPGPMQAVGLPGFYSGTHRRPVGPSSEQLSQAPRTRHERQLLQTDSDDWPNEGPDGDGSWDDNLEPPQDYDNPEPHAPGDGGWDPTDGWWDGDSISSTGTTRPIEGIDYGGLPDWFFDPGEGVPIDWHDEHNGHGDFPEDDDLWDGPGDDDDPIPPPLTDSSTGHSSPRTPPPLEPGNLIPPDMADELVLSMVVDDADLGSPLYQSTPDGGHYRFLVWLEDVNCRLRQGDGRYQASPIGLPVFDEGGSGSGDETENPGGGSEQRGCILVQTSLSVELYWGIRPTITLPQLTSNLPSMVLSVPVEWENLPSFMHYPTPLMRSFLFPVANDYREEVYTIALELLHGEVAVFSEHYDLHTYDGTHAFRVLLSDEDPEREPDEDPVSLEWRLTLYAGNHDIYGIYRSTNDMAIVVELVEPSPYMKPRLVFTIFIVILSIGILIHAVLYLRGRYYSALSYRSSLLDGGLDINENRSRWVWWCSWCFSACALKSISDHSSQASSRPTSPTHQQHQSDEDRFTTSAHRSEEDGLRRQASRRPFFDNNRHPGIAVAELNSDSDVP